LLTGDQVRPGDALPIPRRIPGPDRPLTHLNLLQILRESGPGISADVRAGLGTEAELKAGLAPHYPRIWPKMWAMRHAARGHRVGVTAAAALVERGVVAAGELRVQGKRYGIPVHLEFTEELGLIFGLYLAEGHAAERFALFSVREAEVQDELARCFQSCDVPSFRRADGDFVVGARVWRDLFQTLMGGKAGEKRLPDCWPGSSAPTSRGMAASRPIVSPRSRGVASWRRTWLRPCCGSGSGREFNRRGNAFLAVTGASTTGSVCRERRT
jgi:hypothetical protein